MRRADPRLVVAERIRSCSRWQTTRRWKLMHDPLCEDCLLGGRTRVASQVDHVVPLAIAPERAYDPQNLRALCTTCHARKSAKERRT